MVITGKFVRNYGVVSGEENGEEWQRVVFTIMTVDGHSRLVAFTAFGEDRVSQAMSINPGETVLVQFYPESRERGDQVFTELMVTHVSVAWSFGS